MKTVGSTKSHLVGNKVNFYLSVDGRGNIRKFCLPRHFDLTYPLCAWCKNMSHYHFATLTSTATNSTNKNHKSQTLYILPSHHTPSSWALIFLIRISFHYNTRTFIRRLGCRRASHTLDELICRQNDNSSFLFLYMLFDKRQYDLLSSEVYLVFSFNPLLTESHTSYYK